MGAARRKDRRARRHARARRRLVDVQVHADRHRRRGDEHQQPKGRAGAGQGRFRVVGPDRLVHRGGRCRASRAVGVRPVCADQVFAGPAVPVLRVGAGRRCAEGLARLRVGFRARRQRQAEPRRRGGEHHGPAARARRNHAADVARAPAGGARGRCRRPAPQRDHRRRAGPRRHAEGSARGRWHARNDAGREDCGEREAERRRNLDAADEKAGGRRCCTRRRGSGAAAAGQIRAA